MPSAMHENAEVSNPTASEHDGTLVSGHMLPFSAPVPCLCHGVPPNA